MIPITPSLRLSRGDQGFGLLPGPSIGEHGAEELGFAWVLAEGEGSSVADFAHGGYRMSDGAVAGVGVQGGACVAGATFADQGFAIGLGPATVPLERRSLPRSGSPGRRARLRCRWMSIHARRCGGGGAHVRLDGWNGKNHDRAVRKPYGNRLTIRGEVGADGPCRELGEACFALVHVDE